MYGKRDFGCSFSFLFLENIQFPSFPVLSMTAPYRRANYGKIIQKYALTVSLSLLTPIVIISIGVIIFSVGDRRVSAIDA